MQLSKLAILSLFSAVAQAAPVVVTVTNVVVVTTVIDAGQTQAVNDAAVTYASSTTSDAAATETTAIVPTSTDAIAAAAVVEPTTTSTPTPTTLSTVETTPVPTTTSSTTSAEPTTSASSTDSDFASEILAEHNAKRALHGVSDLTWDSTLEAYAQAYADKYDCSGSLTHSGGAYGENLALGYTTTGSVDAWYSEGNDYTYGSACSVYDHFTQVIWKSTTKVGCGYKYCNSYWGTYIVCSYDPAGNYVGECDTNVLAPV
ncbi:hypothetical protein C6P40_003195 [Pichia californica]|uniref:SCP domain-containing protein n=1 Tax=Pichia californica TaxID=460514 RepID=A0A9P6WIU1_9ASCO|nr:hypothetical protein C6P42_002962 [[Candida] californica]KAG0686902.1 hypothetical protein C6P40_003195 [[Candida] californica]